jgi:hypothetical protein
MDTIHSLFAHFHSGQLPPPGGYVFTYVCVCLLAHSALAHRGKEQQFRVSRLSG